MRFRRRRQAHQEPSLVPLADMLTNTVGVLFFILVFTVLAAGGVVVPKRLPMEHSTKTEPVHFVCVDQHLLPLDSNALIKKFVTPLGKLDSFDKAESWVQRYNKRRIENGFFTMTGEGEAIYSGDFFSSRQVQLFLTAKFKPKSGAGDTLADLRRPESIFQTTVARQNPKKTFLHFILNPECIEVFEGARTIALEKGFGTGWSPSTTDEISFIVAGGGGMGTPVTQQ